MSTLTPTQAKAVEREVQKKQTQQKGLQDSIGGQQKRVDELTIIDSAYKATFDFYNDDIIEKYDEERAAINGVDIINSVTEQDIIDVSSNPPSGRLVPTPPATDIVRDPAAFDGADTQNLPNHENADNIEQEIREKYLREGVRWQVGTQPTVTAGLRTITAINSSTTQITFEAPVGQNPSFAVGDRFVIHNGAQQCAVEVTNIVSQVPGDPSAGTCSGETPPGSGVDETTCLANGGSWTSSPTDFSATVDIIFLVEGDVAANAQVDKDWAGFANTDRVNKNDATDGYNALLGQMELDLENAINERLIRLNAQKTALENNAENDPTLLAENDTALTNVNDSISFLNDYLVNTYLGDADVGSDAGMDSLELERINKQNINVDRLNEIANALSINNDLRYTFANDRGNTSRGSLRQLNNADSTITFIEGMISSLGDNIDSLKGLLE